MNRVRLFTAALAVALALPGAAAASHDAFPAPSRDVIVAVIDTGIYPQHEMFDYRGPNVTDDQIVGWWDFTGDRAFPHYPGPQDRWDPIVPTPYDDYGHGTATAATAVGGGNGYWYSEPAFAPGYPLAVAKALGSNGDIAAAIYWAVDVIGARVINMSLGVSVPTPAADYAKVYAALRHARRAGALVVVANGNGYLNYGTVPGDPGWASPFASSTDVLSVGASGTQGLLVTTDPEVTARYGVYTACAWYRSCYEYHEGTSFSAPTVAGMAAAAMQERIDRGGSPTPDWIERLLKYSARDTTIPPPFEGYGALDWNEFYDQVLPSAAEGRLPVRPVPDLNGVYVDEGGAVLRDTWSNKVRRTYTPVAPAVSGGNRIGTSTPALAEGERYEVTLEAGDYFYAALDTYSATWAADDIDLYVFSGNRLEGTRVFTQSTGPAGSWEWVAFQSPVRATYTVLAVGWGVAAGADYYLWSASSRGSLMYRGESIYASYAA